MKNVEDALRANDRNTVENALNDVDKAIDHVTGLASRIGSHANRLSFVNDQLESRGLEQKAEISRLTDTDFAKVITNFKKMEASYQAALAVHSRISQTTLLNYI
jgi:flagellin-like hook-associated protein FlgL